MRTMLLIVALLAWPVGRAWATAQVPETLIVDGRVLSMQSTPLAPLLKDRKDLEDVFTSFSSGCWRGYVGTWHVEGDRLYLASLGRERYDRELEREGRRERGGFVWEQIPLDALFGDVEAPVPATWFTGTIRVPLSVGGRYVHMGFATTYDRELHLKIVRGRIVERRKVDTRRVTRGRSEADLSWVGLASVSHTREPVRDDGSWIDARAIPTAAFQKRVPSGRAFITRGILDWSDDDAEAVLRIPETDVTAAVRLRLDPAPTKPEGRTWPHVEVEVTWIAKGGAMSLGLRWLRYLAPGWTIHHPAFPLPAPKPRVTAVAALPLGTYCPVFQAEDVEEVFGCEDVVELRGTLGAGHPQVHGVDVGAAPGLAGQEVAAVGVLEKWIITERLLALDLPAVAPFRERGPGTYYRLVHPDTGRLAVPRLRQDEGEDESDGSGSSDE